MVLCVRLIEGVSLIVDEGKLRNVDHSRSLHLVIIWNLVFEVYFEVFCTLSVQDHFRTFNIYHWLLTVTIYCLYRALN